MLIVKLTALAVSDFTTNRKKETYYIDEFNASFCCQSPIY